MVFCVGFQGRRDFDRILVLANSITKLLFKCLELVLYD